MDPHFAYVWRKSTFIFHLTWLNPSHSVKIPINYCTHKGQVAKRHELLPGLLWRNALEIPSGAQLMTQWQPPRRLGSTHGPSCISRQALLTISIAKANLMHGEWLLGQFIFQCSFFPWMFQFHDVLSCQVRNINKKREHQKILKTLDKFAQKLVDRPQTHWPQIAC